MLSNQEYQGLFSEVSKVLSSASEGVKAHRIFDSASAVQLALETLSQLDSSHQDSSHLVSSLRPVVSDLGSFRLDRREPVEVIRLSSEMYRVLEPIRSVSTLSSFGWVM